MAMRCEAALRLQQALILTVMLVWALPAMAGQTTIAVAANFTDAMRVLAPLFEQTSGHQLRVSHGSTGKLYAQILHGAPYDVFLAADEARPLKAEQAGLAVKGSRLTYARGRLVLWSADADLFDDGAAFLAQGTFARAAMANPKTAPYGLAAQQVLEHLALWSPLQSKMVRGDSIAQTFQFVATGNAALGFVAASQVQAWPNKGSAWSVPESYHAPIAQQLVLLKRGADNPAALAFVEFIQSDRARTLIRDLGYGIDD